MNIGFVSFFLIVSVSFSNGLFEDQVGKFDWRHQYVGKSKFVLFDTSSATVKKVITATAQNVVASINARTGQIVWRQIFERAETSRIDDLKLHDGNLISVLGGGTYVRCLTASVGDLVWEFNVEGASINNVARLLIHDDFVYVLAGDKVVAYNTDMLQVEWTASLTDKNVASYSYLAMVGGDLIVGGLASGGYLALSVIAPDTGAVRRTTTVAALWSTASTECNVVNKHLVCIDNPSQALQTLNFIDPVHFKVTYLQDLNLVANKASFQRTQDENSEFIILQLVPTNTAILAVNAGSLRLVKLLAGAAAAQIVPYNNKMVILDVVKYAPGAMQSSAFDVETGAAIEDLTISVNYADHHGTPREIYGLSFKKRDGTPIVKLLLLSEDHSMVMLQTSGKLAWTREESLASIVSVEMVDYPVSPILAKMEDEFGGQDGIVSMFINRFTTQLLQLKELLWSLNKALLLPGRAHETANKEADVVSRDDPEDDDLTRDEFNLHKMITVITSAGKIFGLRSENGKPEWKHLLKDLAPFTMSGKERLLLFVQRTTAHFPHTPIATLIGKHEQTGLTLAYSFDPITGKAIKDMPDEGLPLTYKIQQVTMLSHLSEAFVRPILVLDKQLKYHVYPESLTDFVTQVSPSLYMFTCDVEKSALVGYNVKPQGELMIAQDLWTINLAKDSQQITQVVGKRAQEHVHSHGVVLGDRTVLYKYVNPNLVVVSAEGTDSQGKSFINIYLVDAVTGHIPFHCNHKKAKGPINIVHSENWVVYTYWNDRFRRNEVAVIELYEGPQQSNATTFSSLAPPPPPIVMRQAYILNAHITAAQHTITERGITHKHIIMALEMGGVLGMPKGLVDARRPLAPSQESREEGLMPYIPELPVAYEMFINYNQSVSNIHGIQTAPAGLESTSMVFCYGLDLFFTRVMPSKMFDVLKEDFEYFFISAVLGGMILVSVVARKLAMRKSLLKAWK